ncbi:DUF5615 family PIN-like protein [Halocola ammonii]
MKLLFDQNISFRIIPKIKEIFPESIQVREAGLENSTDIQIWDFARIKGYTIVTFDADFYELANIKGIPPKIIWLRMGNTSTTSISEKLRSFQNVIVDFVVDAKFEEVACLEID